MVVGVLVFAWWVLCAQAATFAEVGPATFSDECDKLADPLHGRVVQPDRSVGANVTIECDQGYVYTEATWRTCSSTKVWSGTAGICKEVLCAPLPPVDHGRVTHSDGTYLSTSVVTCDEGYLYDQPDRHRTCERHNFWSGESGQCQAVSCPELGEVDHGQLVSSGRGYLDSVVVHCDADYELTGAGVVRCGADGTWSHRLGSCLPPATSQDALSIVLPVCLTIAFAAVVIGVLIWRRQRAKKSNSDPENEPLRLPTMHCLFTLNEELPDDISTSEYSHFEDAIKEAVTTSISTLTDVDVTVTLVNQVNRKVFIDIVYQSALEKKDVKTVIMSTKIVTRQQQTYHCQPDSVHFRDEETDALAVDVFRKRHVTDQILDKRIDFDREYVRLDWSPETQAGDTVARQDSHPGTNIEDDYLACRQGKEFVLIQGRAGIGKTTLIQRLMWRWANGDWATRFKALFLLNVRHLMTVNKDVDLPRLLSRYAVYKTATISMEWLQDNQDNIGILIDGIDEIPNFTGQWKRHEKVTEGAKPLDWCLSILKHNHLPKATIFVTSRPFKGMRALGITQLHEPLKVVELRGLTEQGILEYVYTNVKRGRRDFVKDTLYRNQTLLSVSSIPFYCAALCELLGREDPSPDDLNTYTRITAFIFQMYLKRSRGKDWSGDELTRALLSMSKLAHHGLVETGEDVSISVFNKKDFNKLNLDDIAIGLMLRTGLLVEGLDAEDGDTTVEFVQLSMQELLAMCELLKRDPDHVKKTLTTLCRSEQFNMALLFLYGLAFDDKNKTIQSLSDDVSLRNEHRQNVQWVLTSPQQDLSGHLQAVQTIHESQSALVAKTVGANMFTTGVELATKLTLVDLRSLTFLLEHNPDVKVVQMTNVDLDAVSMAEFVNFLKGNTTVQELCLVENVDNSWLREMMEAVAENKGLHSLQLPCSNISDQMLDFVGIALWKNKTLTNLWLKELEIGEEGTQALLSALKANTKVSLKISKANCTEEQQAEKEKYGTRFKETF